ncbi:MAG: SDR family oxidoreductase, partial [Caulobacteraceae bacterium]
MHALSTHMAAQYGPLGIRTNCVAPGVTPTPMTEGRYENETFIKMNNHMTPYPRLATVDDIVNTIAFLCTPAAEFINGQVIAVDGGWSCTKYLSDFGRESEWVARG